MFRQFITVGPLQSLLRTKFKAVLLTLSVVTLACAAIIAAVGGASS